MEKATSTLNLRQEIIYTDCESLSQAIWNTIVTVHDKLKVSHVTLSISDSNSVFVLSYLSNGKTNFINFPFRNLDLRTVINMINDLAGKSSINGKVFCEQTVMDFVFRYN